MFNAIHCLSITRKLLYKDVAVKSQNHTHKYRLMKLYIKYGLALA